MPIATTAEADSRRNLRILLVTNRFPSRGAPFSGTFVPPLRRALEDAGAIVDWAIVNRHELGPRCYVDAPRALHDAAARFQPDVVHVLWGGSLALITVTAIKRVPVVVTFGGGDLDGLYLSRSEGPVEHVSRFLAVASSRLAAARAKRIVLVSKSLLENLPARLHGTCSIVPAALDPELFAPLDRTSCRRELGWEPGRKHVLFPSSSLRPEKRFELAERAVALLRRRGHRVQLHELRSVPHAQVPKWMNAADVVLLTSRSEGSPRALREALACGRPTVCVAVGDSADWLAPLERCRITRADPASIADSVEAVWDFDHLPEAREISRRYTFSAMAEKLCCIYSTCLEESPKSRLSAKL